MLDRLDVKIITALQKDARIPFVDLAKKLKVSPGIVQARFNRLKKSGVIAGTTLILNMVKTGPIYNASIGIEAVESNLEDVNNYIKGLKIEGANIFSWITFGRYNIAMAVFSKNLLEVHQLKQLIKQHPSVLEVSINLSNMGPDEAVNAGYEALDLEKIFKE